MWSGDQTQAGGCAPSTRSMIRATSASDQVQSVAAEGRAGHADVEVVLEAHRGAEERPHAARAEDIGDRRLEAEHEGAARRRRRPRPWPRERGTGLAPQVVEGADRADRARQDRVAHHLIGAAEELQPVAGQRVDQAEGVEVVVGDLHPRDGRDREQAFGVLARAERKLVDTAEVIGEERQIGGGCDAAVVLEHRSRASASSRSARQPRPHPRRCGPRVRRARSRPRS